MAISSSRTAAQRTPELGHDAMTGYFWGVAAAKCTRTFCLSLDTGDQQLIGVGSQPAATQ